MSPTRREFIKRVGIALASLMAARCACIPLVEGGSGVGGTPRERLRRSWQRFGWLEEQASDWSDYGKGERARKELVAEHRAALDDLVAAGELDADVTDLVQEAFAEAAYHVWRANCGATCYEPMSGPEYTPYASGQLVQQAELLTDLADDATIDPETITRAHAAVERGIAFLNLSPEEEQVLYDAVIEAAGEDYNYPTFEELELEVTSEAAEAARFLVELLLEE
ncbi:MAG: hypothetical protein JXA14_01675 [Anaerolineae bacterium]|nr:hypothetical protein [Anaerolineae bacterium]